MLREAGEQWALHLGRGMAGSASLCTSFVRTGTYLRFAQSRPLVLQCPPAQYAALQRVRTQLETLHTALQQRHGFSRQDPSSAPINTA